MQPGTRQSLRKKQDAEGVLLFKCKMQNAELRLHPKGTSADFVLGRHALQSKARNDRGGEKGEEIATAAMPPRNDREKGGRLGMTGSGASGSPPPTGGEKEEEIATAAMPPRNDKERGEDGVVAFVGGMW